MLQAIQKIDIYLLIIIILAIIFFVVYSWLPFNTSGIVGDTQNKLIFNSPDETANFWAANQFYQSGSFLQFSQASLIAGDIVSPRSMRIINNHLVPTGFIGMPWLYGLMAQLFNSNRVIPYLTPWFAVIGIIFLYLFTKDIFDKKIGFITSLLCFSLPSYWYYASKGLMPNILFISLAIISLYFFLVAIRKQTVLFYILTGLLVGLALLVRPIEVLWLLPVYVGLTFINYKQVHWLYVWLVPIFGLATLLPMFYHNIILFGSAFDVGYQMRFTAQFADSKLLTYLMPFGYDWAIIKMNVVNYLHNIFSMQSSLLVVSLFLFIVLSIKKGSQIWKRNFTYLLFMVVVSGLLILFYGSWKVYDHPNPRAITIGTSFVRYWLPLYILSLPIIGFVITRIFAKSKTAWALVVTSIFLITLLFGYNQVMLDKQEGLKAVRDRIVEYKHTAALVLNHIPDNSVVVAKKSDKVFFPARDVIYDLFYEVDFKRVAKLATQYPVYLWDWNYDEQALFNINNDVYGYYNLKLIPEEIAYNKMKLYKIVNVY